jgi:hypothetical protein
MWRIASLFLLQWLNRSKSEDACDFNNIETQTVIKFFSLQGKVLKEIHAILTETLGKHAPSYANDKNQVAQLNLYSLCVLDIGRHLKSPSLEHPTCRTATASAIQILHSHCHGAFMDTSLILSTTLEDVFSFML